jgi:hypothetical protein
MSSWGRRGAAAYNPYGRAHATQDTNSGQGKGANLQVPVNFINCHYNEEAETAARRYVDSVPELR